MGLTPALQNAELWPIRAKTKVANWHPLGDPSVEHYYHEALEDGRELQKSIADANYWLIKERQNLQKHIQQLFNHVAVATTGKLDNPWRAIKYGYDIINFMQQVATFQQNIIALIQAVTQNIGMLQSMEQNILGMIQANLNAVASLLHDICNWGLPDLPAIPNMFADGMWHWNGFNFFPLASFIPHTTFDASFAFGQCNIHLPNVNVLRNFPTTVQSYSGLTYGTPLFVPPLGGIIPDTGINLSSQTFIDAMRAEKTTPYYTNDASYAYPFNPQTSMNGSLPDPNTVISGYRMPAATYRSNVISSVPALLGDVVMPADPDYASPDLAVRQPALRKDLIHSVTLGQVVASDYDPNLTSAWLFYVGSARGTGGGRAGQWLDNFQAAYQQYVQPSLDYLAGNPIPWNRVLPGTTLAAGPTAVPLISVLSSPSSPPVLTDQQGNILWKLSYVEAALLGYSRNTAWDGFADSSYVGSFTGTDLDYASLDINPSSMTTLTLGEGEAGYPVPCTFPTAIGKSLGQVIAMADVEITSDTAFRSAHPQYRYVYDQFAVAVQVDRFSQFWREFNGNLQALLIQDPYLVGFVCAYPEALDSAIDPLGNPAVYDSVKADVASRNRSWVPGFPLLDIPKAPVVAYSNNSTPDPSQNGWPGGNFDAAAYLARPDIQGQPIPVQMAMLTCNLSAASLMQYRSDITSAINNAIVTAEQQVQSLSDFGFQVESFSDVTTVPSGLTGVLADFDQIDFDMTGYVTSSNTFTVQATGAYALSGQINWGTGSAGVRTVTVFDSSVSPPLTVAILTASTDPSQAGPVTLPFSDTANLTEGDILTVVVSHSLPDPQQVLAGSMFSAILYSPNHSTTPTVVPTSGGSQVFLASVDLAALTAVYVDISGGVSPIDPTSVTTDIMSSPPFPHAVFPFVDGVTLSSAQAGGPVQVATAYGGVFQVPGAGFTTGGLLYVGPGTVSPPTVGTLTQSFDDIVLTSCKWVICVGKSVDDQTFILAPHIPSRTVDSF